MSKILRLTAFLVLLPALALAADLRITDSSGAQVTVRNASIDYSGVLGSAVRESNGIRVQQGDATVTVKWKDIQSLTIAAPREASRPSRLDVDVLLRNGRRVAAALSNPADAKLRGRTDLGEYALGLDKVRAIETLR